MRRKAFVWRLYSLTVAIAALVIVATYMIPRYLMRPLYAVPQAALVEGIADGMAGTPRAGIQPAMDKLGGRLKDRGEVAVFTAGDHTVIGHTGTGPGLSPPTETELADLAKSGAHITPNRIVVQSGDHSLIAIYEPHRPALPWLSLSPAIAVILLLLLLASLWFSRRIARPLAHLADTANRFGAGDITARAAMPRNDELGDVGRAFDQMADRTANVLLSQRRLLADVSHELRTPLARIRVALELAEEDPVAARDVLTDLGGDLDEIEQLIDDLLTAARLDASNIGAEVPRRATDLAPLLADAERRFTTRHPRHHLRRAGEPSAVVECEPVLLRRAIDNLLDNAAKYSSDGSEVVLELHAKGDGVAIEVVDQGVGMSPAELAQAFTPFWRADTSRARATGGVGLGLSLARRIARAHGGDITLTSQLGQGTQATVSLPLPSAS